MRSLTKGLCAALVTIVVAGACGFARPASRPLGEPLPASRIIRLGDLSMLSRMSSAYDAVETLRPNFLYSRGAEPTVYVNGQLYGSLATLRHLSIDEIEEMRLLTGPQATKAFGTAHTGAIVHVILRGRR